MTKDRPNLIYVFADQLGLNHCGYAGSEQAKTPNIDSLSKQGVNFTNAVSTMPVCAAYRASLFTGKYTTSTGMVINELRMNPNHECIGHVLTWAGYETAYIGKWHLWANEFGAHEVPKNSFVPPGPYRLGFDGYWAGYNFNHMYYEGFYHEDTIDRTFFGPDVYEPDGQTDLAIDILKQRGEDNKPFAMFLSYGTPHDPWSDDNVPGKYREMFRDTPLPNPPNYEHECDKYADRWAEIPEELHAELEAWRRNYYAMTANLDWNIGRLLEALEKAGLADNTILVFTSDHGEMFGAHGRAAKNIFYEEAARIPFLMRWPGVIPEGYVSDACLGTVDVMPTLLSMMGLPAPGSVEGDDLSHCARAEEGPEPEAAFLQNTGCCALWEDGHEWRAARDKRFTYAVFKLDGRELLFDNIADPYQMKDLSQDPQFAADLERLREFCRRKMESLNDNFELSSYYQEHWVKDRVILRSATME